MKLFLASEGKHPETIKTLDKYVGGLTGKRIAYIPTAGNGEGWGSWKESRSLEILNTLNTEITIVQLEDFINKDLMEKLQNKDIIWVAGGMCGYLMYWMRRMQLDKYLPMVLKQGTVYVGSSAGSMVTGKSLEVAEWYVPDLEYGAGYLPGLELVDFDIYPHYEESQLEDIKKNYKGNKLYLLKNGEQIIVEDSVVKLIGEERILSSH